MSNLRIPSSVRSQGSPVTLRRHKLRLSRSVGSPARSTTSGRQSNIVDNKDSFAASPLSKTVLSDNSDIEMPRRKSWWRKIENSRDMAEVLDNDQPVNPNNVFEEFFGVEVLSQEKNDYSIDLPESSGSESIHSIVVPQRKLFVQQKENLPEKKFGAIASTSSSHASKPNLEDQTIHAGTKKLFGQQTKRSKPVFPSALLNLSNDNTLANKTKELPTEVKAQAKGLFGNRPVAKRKNIFADFVVSESEEEIPDIQPKRFTFSKPSDGTRRSSVTSSVTTDIEMDDWKLLPSSTMVDHQLEEQLTTPGKRARLSKLSEVKESTKTDTTIHSNKSVSSKNKSLSSLAKVENTEKPNFKKKSTSPTKKSLQDETATEKIFGNKNNSISNVKQNIPDSVNDEIKETSNVKNKTYDINKTFKQNIPDSVNEEIKETSIVKNKTYDINKTMTKELSKRKTAEEGKDQTYNINKTATKDVSKNNVAEDVKDKTSNITKTNTKDSFKNDQDEIFHVQQSAVVEPVLDQQVEEEEEEEITLTYEDNDPQGQDVERNNDTAKSVSVDNKMSKVSEYMENLEKEMSRIVGYETEHILQMETPMPNKSVRSTNKFVEETPDYKSEERKSRHNTSSKELSEKIQQPVDAIAENNKGVTQDKESISEQIVMNIINNAVNENQQTEVLAQALNVDNIYEAEKVENVKDNNDPEHSGDRVEAINELEHSEDLIEASDQDQAEAEIEASDQDETEAEQELEVDDEEDNQSEDSKEEVELKNNEESDVEQEKSKESDPEQDDEESEADEQMQEEEEEIQEEDEQNEMQPEVLNESGETEDDARNESLNAEDQNQDEDESQNVENIEEVDESQENDEADQNESQEEIEESEGNIVAEINESVENDPENVTHDTTGRNRKKRAINTPDPEAVLLDATDEMVSFTAKGRNTSIRKTKSIIKNFTIRQSMAPARESTGLSDGTKNSSTEGSGWDSHRTTRKTLRQTFGKDFTPRKSLRALVMEKSAKRQTMINEANAQLKLHEANSTELPEHDDVIDHENAIESDHEASRELRQAKLDMFFEKIKKENMEIKRKIEESLKPKPRQQFLHFEPFNKLPIRRTAKAPPQNEPKVKRTKSSAISLENLPPELIEDMKYKPPKRFKPRNVSWITKRLYKYLETKLEPKYDYKARIRAEKLVETIYNFVRDTRRLRVAPPRAIDQLKWELARLEVVSTHFEFYDFIRDFLPHEAKVKVVPDIINNIPLPREGVFAPIIA